MKIRNSDSGVVMEVTCAAPQTLAEIRAAHDSFRTAKATLDEAESKLRLIQRNPDAIELQGKIPADEIVAAWKNVEVAARGLSTAKSHFVGLVLNERSDFDSVRDDLLNSIRTDKIAPAVQSIRDLVAQCETAILAAAEKLSAIGIPSLDLGGAESFDGAIASWNALLSELGAPSNALVDASWGARVSLVTQIISVVNEFKRVDCAIVRLRQAARDAQQKFATAR